MDPVAFANSMTEGIVSIMPLTDEEEDSAEDTPRSGIPLVEQAPPAEETFVDGADSFEFPDASEEETEIPVGSARAVTEGEVTQPTPATDPTPLVPAAADATPNVREFPAEEPALAAPAAPDSTGQPRAVVSDALSDLGEPEVEVGEYVPLPLPRVIAVANQKGGVGKTTTAVNLGAALAELGYRVLVLDLDPQANATTGMGVDPHSFEFSMYDVLMRDTKLEDAIEPTSIKNLFVAPATIDLAGAEIELVPTFSRELKLRRALEPITTDFDYTLIDCPPSLGLITVNGLAAATEVLVPIQCEYYALEGLGQLLRNVQLVKANLNDKLEVTTIVLTMYDGRTKLAEQVVDEVRAHFGNKVCRNVIPRTVRLSEAPSYGQPITTFDSGSRGAIAYRELAREVSGGGAA